MRTVIEYRGSLYELVRGGGCEECPWNNCARDGFEYKVCTAVANLMFGRLLDRTWRKVG